MTLRDVERYKAARDFLTEHPHAADNQVADAAGLYLTRPGDRGILRAAKEDAADEPGPGTQ